MVGQAIERSLPAWNEDMLFRIVFSALLALAPIASHAQTRGKPNQVMTRIAFGSCANQEREQPIWSAISAYRPELFIFAGDNVYGDILNGKVITDDSRRMEALKLAYNRAAMNTELTEFRSKVPHLATWDDHDYGKNDAGGDFALKEESQKLFVDFWDLPSNDPRRTRPGIYHAVNFGPAGKRLQVILLDTRYFRSPLKPNDKRGPSDRAVYIADDTPEKTMLGSEQWSWLEERLKEPADLRLIVSSIQVVADGHGWERWGNFPRERQRLYDLIRSTKAGRVIFLTGDRHVGAIYKETANAPYPLYDMTASGLTQYFSGANEPGPNRISPLYGAENFGTIDVDWWANTLTLSLRRMNGEAVRTHTIDMAEITSSP